VPADVRVFVTYQLALTALIELSAARHGLGLSELSYVFRKNDASWYLSIAHHGYRPSGERPAAIAFFPLYPATVRAAMFVVRKDVVAAFAVSSAASVAGHALFYRALRTRPELATGSKHAVALLVVWPTTIYFALLYSESVYLAATAGFLYFLLSDRIGLAALFAAAAALTRQPGVLCIVPLALWVLTDPSRGRRARVGRLGWIGVAASGYAAFLVLNRLVYDDWFAFLGQLRSHWGKYAASPVRTIPDAIGFLRDPDWYFGWPIVADHIFVLASMVVLALWPIVCRDRFERCRWVLLAWGGVQWLMIASSSATSQVSAWMSSTRYLMLVLPLYVALVDLARNRRSIICVLGVGSTVLAAASLERWITKQWIA
jgi:hypothetical protein